MDYKEALYENKEIRPKHTLYEQLPTGNHPSQHAG